MVNVKAELNWTNEVIGIVKYDMILIKKYIFVKKMYVYTYILGVVKRNPLFLHEIEWKNNGFLFTTPNI